MVNDKIEVKTITRAQSQSAVNTKKYRRTLQFEANKIKGRMVKLQKKINLSYF